MSQLTYTPDNDIRVHEEGAIRLICRAFQSHENGLPEWLKNAADAYARENASEEKRIIVLFFDYGRREVQPSISCLDFSGMTSYMIEENFRIWADPESARRGSSSFAIQGGHGNGGKCYMTQMFDDYSYFSAVKNNKRNCYGVGGGSIRFGYIPNREQGKDILVNDLASELDNELRRIRFSINSFSKPILNALKMADGFTLVKGVSPKGYANRIPAQKLIESLQEHTQMIQTLELCKVYVIVNGEIIHNKKPLQLPEIEPEEGYEKPRIIEIPKLLKDPRSNEMISTTNNGTLPKGELILKTSDVSMRWSKKGRHNIVYKSESGYIGFIAVSELDIQSAFRDRIYGECNLKSLEPFKQNERRRLADSPLTRSLECFISEQIQEYCREFEARDRRRYNKVEKNIISRMNEALDRWKNQFLNEILKGMWGKGGKEGPEPTRSNLPSGIPAKIELILTHHKAGKGVAFRPNVKFFDSENRRIRSSPFRFVSEDNNVAMVDEDLIIINTFSFGQTFLHAETLDSKIVSNKISLEVVKIREIKIIPPEIELPVGSRFKLEAICRLANDEETNDVYLEWTGNNPNIARVSSAGLVFCFSPGQTEVVAKDERCRAINSSVIKVTEDGTRGKGKNRGRGYPKVLVSEYEVDPETDEHVIFSREDPPVWQRPQDVERNVWWINSAAPLARLYLDSSKGYGYESREWRMYHLERYVDIIVQIALTNGPTEKQNLSVDEWIGEWGSRVVEIQEAAASQLKDFLYNGEYENLFK